VVFLFGLELPRSLTNMGESAFEVFSTLAANASATGFQMPVYALPPVESATQSSQVFEELRDNMARQGAELPVAQRLPLLASAGCLAVNHF
jgi:hypothetical protein